MFRKLFCLALALCFFSACASSQRVQRGPFKPKPFVTPWEYYQNAQPAVFNSGDEVQLQNAAVHSTGSDTDSDKSHMVLIGILVGVSVVGGTVAGILLTR